MGIMGKCNFNVSIYIYIYIIYIQYIPVYIYICFCIHTHDIQRYTYMYLKIRRSAMTPFHQGGPNFFQLSGSQLTCRPSSCWPQKLEACSALFLHRSDWWPIHQASRECDHQSCGTVILEASVGKQKMSLQPTSNTFDVFFLLVNKIRDRLC